MSAIWQVLLKNTYYQVQFVFESFKNHFIQVLAF